MNGLAFLRNAMRDRGIGAVTRSSRQTVARVADSLPSSCTNVVEYGPGDGVVTRALLDRLPANGRLLTIERNEAFLSELRRISDPRFVVRAGDVRVDAATLRTLMPGPIDAVVSSLPFAIFTPEERVAIIRMTRDALRPGGRFIVCQYTPLILPLLRAHFTHVRIRTAPWNFPPYLVFVGEK